MSSLSLSVVRALDEHSLLLLYGGGEGSGTASVYCGNEWTVRAVFGMLPPVEQQIVLRLATCGAGGCALGLAALGRGRPRRRLRRGRRDARGAALRRARRRRGRRGRAAPVPRAGLPPEPAARGGGDGRALAREPLKADKRKPTGEQLAQWTVWRWTNVLLFLIGTDLDESAVPPPCVPRFLESSGIDGDRRRRRRRGHGPRRRLPAQERHEQVWALVDEYIRAAGDAKGEVVALVLTLAYATPGEGYAIHELSEAQKAALDVLFALGLVYRRNASSSRFYPTTLGVDVAFGARRSAGGARAGGDFRRPVDVIVQTNFQVLAYTDAGVNTSTLVLATLNLFAELTTRLPNLVVGTISRDAIKRCVDRGIRVPQIVKWRSGRRGQQRRVHGRVLVALDSDALYDAALDAARDLDARVHWKSARKRCLFVDAGEPDLQRRRARREKRKAPDN
ncbi:hypothetical protein JL720_13634 [Aureococcus anophagefferens]|nr:hypothetical protein JL720_13634 [Aureococcus anophagefferens]